MVPRRRKGTVEILVRESGRTWAQDKVRSPRPSPFFVSDTKRNKASPLTILEDAGDVRRNLSALTEAAIHKPGFEG